MSSCHNRYLCDAKKTPHDLIMWRFWLKTLSLEAFDNARCAHTCTDAHGDHTVATACAF